MKHFIKSIVPQLLLEFLRVKRRAKNIRQRSAKEIFTSYKEIKFWQSKESVSGDGSELEVTKDLRIALEDLLNFLDIRTMLDIPCGDFNWMKAVNLKHVI